MPKKVDHDKMRSQLLAAAGEVFARYGYAATGMRELAVALKVSTGTLYHYFSDKKTLFDQLVERAIESDLEELENALTSLPSSPLSRLDAFLLLARREEVRLQLQMAVLMEYARLARDNNSGDLSVLRKTHIRYATKLAGLLGVSRDQGEFLVHALTGLLLQRYVDANATSFAPFERQMRAFLETSTKEKKEIT